MTSPAEPQQSVTIADTNRRREEARRLAGLLVLGDASTIAPPPSRRVIAFDTTLHIGRREPEEASTSSWVVKDPLVSGAHCSIEKVGDGYVLKDLNSRNGTAVDGQLVKGPLKLRD